LDYIEEEEVEEEESGIPNSMEEKKAKERPSFREFLKNSTYSRPPPPSSTSSSVGGGHEPEIQLVYKAPDGSIATAITRADSDGLLTTASEPNKANETKPTKEGSTKGIRSSASEDTISWMVPTAGLESAPPPAPIDLLAIQNAKTEQHKEVTVNLVIIYVSLSPLF
jgi:hypothetical protein